MTSELKLIEWLKKSIPRRLQGTFGIGDDAEILAAPENQTLVITTDALVDGVDFISGKLSPEKIGRKALAVNLSDLAAMAAEPAGFLVTLGLPRRFASPWVRRFYKGLLPLASRYKALCLGGDLSASPNLFISVTAMGTVPKKGTGSKPARTIVTRRGANVGDWIVVTGRLGGSILQRHYMFEPRIREARFLAARFRPTAMIDVSDGLLQDLEHILEASRKGAVLDLEKIPVSADAKKIARGNSEKALERALSDGEDFELLFTCLPAKKSALEKSWPRRFPRVPLSWIGRIERGDKIRWRLQGKPAAPPRLKKKGYQHWGSQ